MKVALLGEKVFDDGSSKIYACSHRHWERFNNPVEILGVKRQQAYQLLQLAMPEAAGLPEWEGREFVKPKDVKIVDLPGFQVVDRDVELDDGTTIVTHHLVQR